MNTESYTLKFMTCQIELARKEVILLSDTVVILCRAGSHTGIKKRNIKFTLSAGT